jgi:hypothetical protein
MNILGRPSTTAPDGLRKRPSGRPLSADGVKESVSGADERTGRVCTDADPQQKECSMKARLYRLTTTVALLAVVVEVLGAGAKWS